MAADIAFLTASFGGPDLNAVLFEPSEELTEADVNQRIGNLRRPLSSQQCAEWALCQRWRASYRAEAGPIRPIEAAMLTGPDRPARYRRRGARESVRSRRYSEARRAGGSSMLALTLSFPPQRRHTSMSIQASEATPKVENTRLRRRAQLRTVAGR
jgi:hypothetical protein